MSNEQAGGLENFLLQHFSFSEFRYPQREIIESLLQSKSTLALMPTGGGKSLCYQFLALWFNQNQVEKKLVLVISPLIALMQDQTLLAKDLKIQAAFLSSLQSQDEREKIQKKLSAKKIELLFVTPERFKKPEFRDAIRSVEVKLMVVDEAHCISLWGHDFRPEYSQLLSVWEFVKKPPRLFLSATFTPLVEADVIKKMQLTDYQKLKASIYRPNLALNVHDLYGLSEKQEWLLNEMQKADGPYLVYFSLIGTLEKCFEFLKARLKGRVEKYHSELKAEQRKKNLTYFINSEAPDVLLATPAFGLGVNKANLRRVVHFEIPASLEAYFQEVGRAGRDGKSATCDLLFDGDDLSIQMEFMKWSNPDIGFMQKVLALVRDYGDRYRSEKNDFLREQLNYHNKRDFRVESSLEQLARLGCLKKDPEKDAFVFERDLEVGVDLVQESIDQHLKNQQIKLLKMLEYAKNDKTPECRWQVLHRYFGEELTKACGVCDFCRQPS